MTHMRLRNEAVGEVVSTLLTLMIVLGVVAALLIWGIPYLEEREIQGESQTVYGGFDVMYDTMSGLIFDGYGSKGYCNIVSTNELATLNIDSQDKKLILMYTFPGPDNGHSGNEYINYDFNVSGLDNEDSSFTIEANDENLIDDIKIYWLDPGQTQQLTYESTPYKNIYQNYWCVQSFTTPEDGWELEKVKIYIMKRGGVSSNLNVSIYPDNGDGTPNFNNTLSSSFIQSADINTSFEWIECNIPDITLSAATYYIGLNTSGGGFENGVYNYYRWYLTKNSPYNYSSYYAYTTIDNGLSWTPLSDYDFEYRLLFSDNTPPDTPVFINPIQLQRFLSGVNNPVTVSAIDNDGDKVNYRIFWGDNTYDEITNWVSGVTYNFWHSYKKPGTYTLSLQAIDDKGHIYNPDNITEVYVSTGDYLPDDKYYEENPTIVQNPGGPPYTWSITTQNSRPLNGTLRIDLFSSSAFNNIPFGRIWVFNLGYITYESPHNMGTQRTIFENGGILSFGPVSNGIYSPPSFFEEDNTIGFRIIQLEKSYIASASGLGVYEIGLNMRNSFSREPRVTEPDSEYARIYNLKMQINDSFAEVCRLWTNYFITSYYFGELPDRPNTIYYKEEGKYFVLDSSFIEANVEGLR